MTDEGRVLNPRFYGRLADALKREALCSACALVLFIPGCPKRQGPARIVYGPAPPAAPALSSSTPPQTLVIEEPEPPPPAEKASEPEPATPQSKPIRPRRRILR